MNWRLANASTRKRVAAISLLVMLVLVGQAEPQDSEPTLTKDHPLSEIDLRKFGYGEFSGTRRLPTFVDFTDASHLGLAWLTFDDPTVTKKTGPLTSKPTHFHVLTLDARTGQKQGLQEWPTPSNAACFLGVRDGKFLICTGSVLRLLSPSFGVIREQDLPSERACPNPFLWLGDGVSPSRRSLLVSFPSGETYQRMLLDTETLTAVANWIEKPPTYGISDHWLVGRCGQPLDICIRGIDQSWQPFRPVGLDKRTKDSKSKSALFVNDGTLVIEAVNELAVARVDGTMLFHVDLPKGRSFGWPVTSSGGNRFAVIENRLRGLTNEALDMYAFPSNDRVVVYSIPDRRAIYAVRVKGESPWPPWKRHVNRLALSPDGALLGVVSDGILKVYRLPASDIAPH